MLENIYTASTHIEQINTIKNQKYMYIVESLFQQASAVIDVNWICTSIV